MFKINAGIFAAGKGERLKNVFPNIPKPLIKISEKTLIEMVLENISIVKPQKISILLNNEIFSQVSSYLNKDKNEINFISFNSKTSFESFYTLLSFLEDGQNQILLSTVDVIIEKKDLEKFVIHHIERKADITLGVSDIPPDEKPLIVEIDNNSRILSIGEKGNFATNGIYIISPKIVKKITPKKYNALREFLSSIDFEKFNLHSFYFPNSFDIDDETDISKATEFINKKGQKSYK